MISLFLFLNSLSPFEFQIVTFKSKEQRFIDFCLENIQQDEIPTSIKIAQPILESGWGKSKLAKKLNFHGVKCFTNCKEVVYLSDDHPNEKFRVFSSPKESFDYHNRLLKRRSVIGDYKVWAKSLKWYATNPKYGKKLIQIIESYELYKYDKS